MSIEVKAYADKPRREDYESQEAFEKDLKEWEENQVVPKMSEYDWDAEHGPAVDGVKGKFVNEGPGVAHPDHGHDEDAEHGPGVN